MTEATTTLTFTDCGKSSKRCPATIAIRSLPKPTGWVNWSSAGVKPRNTEAD